MRVVLCKIYSILYSIVYTCKLCKKIFEFFYFNISILQYLSLKLLSIKNPFSKALFFYSGGLFLSYIAPKEKSADFKGFRGCFKKQEKAQNAS